MNILKKELKKIKLEDDFFSVWQYIMVPTNNWFVLWNFQIIYFFVNRHRGKHIVHVRCSKTTFVITLDEMVITKEISFSIFHFFVLTSLMLWEDFGSFRIGFGLILYFCSDVVLSPSAAQEVRWDSTDHSQSQSRFSILYLSQEEELTR